MKSILSYKVRHAPARVIHSSAPAKRIKVRDYVRYTAVDIIGSYMKGVKNKKKTVFKRHYSKLFAAGHRHSHIKRAMIKI